MTGPGKSMRQRMLDGELYIADEELERGYLRAQDLTRRINALPANVIAVGNPARIVREL